jgi:spermidine/putrescine transport system permease protein
MSTDAIRRLSVGLFVLMFFAYLFGPLIIMSFTAFNSSQFPRVSPWECFSVEWFDVLVRDTRLMDGLRNSIFIGIGVVLVAVPLGLAGALMLTQVGPRVRPWYYTITISPILVPGVVLGISTLIFWDRLGTMFSADYQSFFYDGIFLTVIGQATFISAYSMLVFISRLQRFDTAQEEAALDLGATHVQAFRKVLLPFLKPAIGSAAVLAFLASFENYNTTVFTIVSESTLTTVLASKVRYGINPSISALAVIIVVITLFGAVLFEIAQRREAAAEKAAARVAAGQSQWQSTRKGARLLDPAYAMVLVVFIAGIGTVYFSGTVGVSECKAIVAEEKRQLIEERIRVRRQMEMFRQAAPKPREPGQAAAGGQQPKIEAKGTEGYQGIFAPGNLQGQVGGSAPASPPKVEAKGTEGYRGMFAPGNLQGQVGSQTPTEKPKE